MRPVHGGSFQQFLETEAFSYVHLADEETGLGKVCNLPRDAQWESGFGRESELIGCLLRGVIPPMGMPSSCKTLDLEGGVIHQGCHPLSPHKTPGWGEGG